MEMKSKNLFGLFLTIACVLFLTAGVSAATTNLVTIDSVKISGVYDTGNEDISISAGEMLSIEIIFTADEDASDVRLEAELEGTKLDVDVEVFVGDIEDGKRYREVLTLKVPYELKDEVSDNVALNLKVWNGDYRTVYPEIVLRVQRTPYEAGIMSITMDQSVDAGSIFPVDIVLKNIGYNYLDDVYVTVTIPALGVEKSTYVGDLDAIEVEDEDDDTLRARVYMKVPYDAPAGVYAIEVVVSNDDFTGSKTQQILIENDFANNLIVSDYSKSFNVGEKAEYSLLIVNPTNKLKVYRVVTESSGSLSTSASETLIAVPAGLSRTVSIFAQSNVRGDYTFDVSVFSGEELVSSVTLDANVESGSAANAIVALTIILTIVFIVLLIVLIVLLRKKPEKTEDFGESYY